MDSQHDTVTMLIKALVAWLGVILAHLGIEKWSDAAAMLASVYTFILICEWIWRRVKKHRTDRMLLEPIVLDGKSD